MRHVPISLALVTALLASPLVVHAADRLFTIQAESGALGANFLTATAGGVTYITTTVDQVSSTAPGQAGKTASYTVTFPQAGTWNLYARIRVGPASASDDSFYYGTGFGLKTPTDANHWTLVNNVWNLGYTAPTATVLGAGTVTTGVWKWLKLTPNNFGEPSTSFVVAAGALTQTFQLGTRENGLDLDQFAFALAGREYLVADFTNTPPAITAGQSFLAYEGADNGTTLGTVLATDPDPGAAPKDWAITGGTGMGLFAINAATGVLTVANGAALNMNLAPSYTLTLTVNDNVTTSAEQTVKVIVEKLESILVSGPPAGNYREGQVLTLTVQLGRNMIVDVTGGIPRIALGMGGDTRYASYYSGSGTNQLVFRYPVQPGDNDSDGITVRSPMELNGGTIRDSSTADVGLGFVAPNTAGVLVDAVAPAAPVLVAFSGHTLAGTAEGGSTVALFLNGVPAGTAIANSAGQWTRGVDIWSFGLGSHYVAATATATDLAGNTGPASGAFNLAFTVDPLAPVIVQAESGMLGADFATGTTGGAVHIGPLTDALSPTTAPQSASKIASYTVSFPQAGTYNLYARVRVGGGGASDDSLYYGSGFGAKNVADANAWVLVNNLATAGFADPVDYVTATDTIWGAGVAGANVWKWVRLSSSNFSEPGVSFTVPAGALTQTFQLGSREDGLLIDQLAFGLDGVYFTVPNLDQAAAGTTASPPPPYVPPGPPFATGKPKFLGCFFSSDKAAAFVKYWNQVTPGNAGKWGSVEGTRNVMNWTELDAAYHFAKANGFPFKLHTLVWGNQQPAWIESLPPTEQLAEIEQWFAALAARYPDIDQIDVVNEPLHDPPNQAGNGGGNYLAALGGAGATGWDWVRNAFRLARLHFPRAELLLNDYNITTSTTSTQNYLAIIQLLQAEGLIDGIGVQQHAFETKTFSVSALAARLDLLATAGLPIYVTEMDVDGPTDQTQLDEMMRLFPLFWEHPAIAGVTLGGFHPPVWRQEQGANLTWTNGVERPALEWLRTYVMGSNPPLRPAITAQPADVTTYALESALFTVGATGQPAPAIQWQRSADGGATWTDVANAAPFAGANTLTLTVSGVPFALNGSLFRAIAANASVPAVTSAVARLTVNRVPAIVALTGLTSIYDGAPRGAIVDTVPAALALTVTYNGGAALPVNAGSYTVEAVVSDPNYVGSASGTLTISPAPTTLVLSQLTQTFDGTAKSATVTATPAGASVAITYDGDAAPPVNAGSYAVVATITDPNHVGSPVTGTHLIQPAGATITLGNLSQTYDGSPRAVTVTTSPAGVSTVVTYDGATIVPTNAGNYSVLATLANPNYTGGPARGTLVIAPASATVTLGSLVQRYDGTPRPISVTTAPAGLNVILTYDGGASVPIYPGRYSVAGVIDDPNHAGSANATLEVGITALVRHVSLHGGLDGSIQSVGDEDISLNGNAWIAGDVLVPGTPQVRLTGSPMLLDVLEGPGSPAPANYTVTLNGNALVRHIVRCIDPLKLPEVDTPPAPAGTRRVSLHAPGQPAGDFATLRDLAVTGNAGLVAVPPGTYGDFTAGHGSGFVLGVPGAIEPAIYNLQALTLNGGSRLEIVGPVILTLNSGLSVVDNVEFSPHPSSWFTLRIANGGFSMSGSASLQATVTAPKGAVTLKGNAGLRGSVQADLLIVNGNAVLKDEILADDAVAPGR